LEEANNALERANTGQQLSEEQIREQEQVIACLRNSVEKKEKELVDQQNMLSQTQQKLQQQQQEIHVQQIMVAKLEAQLEVGKIYRSLC
jgi:hypothetical protein